LRTNRENTFDSGRNDDHPSVPYERLDVSLKDIAVAQKERGGGGEPLKGEPVALLFDDSGLVNEQENNPLPTIVV